MAGEEIDKHDVRRIARILGLKLNEKEEALFASEINRLLREMTKIEKIDTKGVPPTHYHQEIYPQEESPGK